MADTPIDKLEIEINVKAAKANDAIDELVDRIERLVSSVASLNGVKVGGIDNLGKRVKGVKQTVESITSIYKDVGKGFEIKGSTATIQKKIDNLKNSMAQAVVKKEQLEASGNTGGKMFEYAIRDITVFGNMVKSLEEQLASMSETKLSVDFEVKFEEQEKSGSPTEEAPRIAEVSADSFGYNQDAIKFVEDYSKRAQKSVQGLIEKLSELTVPEVRTDSIEKLNSYIEKAEAKLEELRSKLYNGLTMGTITESVDDKGYVRLQEQIALAEKRLEAFRAKKAEVEQASGTGLERFNSELGKTAKIAQAAKNGMKNFTSGCTTVVNGLKNLISSMAKTKKSTNGLNGSFSSGLKKLLAYGFGIRSLFVLFNRLRSAVSDGMKNLVQFSAETNSSMSLLTSSFTQAKNASAAMVAPLINALAPALNTIVQWCVSATNALNQLFSALTGKSTWTKATALANDYAASLDNASGSAKNLKNTTLGIDELNINSGDTSSSGGASSGTSAGDMFETVEVETKFKGLSDSLKQMWESADFTELGETINSKVEGALEGIKWNDVYKKAKNFGKGLASFLNGLISPKLFGQLGTTIAGSLNTALNFLNSFGETFEWDDFGESLAASLKNFFVTWDAALAGETLSTFARGLLQPLKSAVEELEDDETFRDIGQKLVDFICDIDWLGVAWDLVGFITSFNSAITSLPMDLFEGIAQGIADKIFGENEVEIEIPEWAKKIQSFLNPLSNPVGKVFSFAEWIVNDVAPWFTVERWGGMLFNVLDAFYTWWDGLVEWWANTAVVNWWNEDVAPWFTVERWNQLGNQVKESFRKKWDEIKTWWANTAIVKWWNEDVAPWFTLKKWSDTVNSIKESLFAKWSETATQWKTNIQTWWNEDVAPWFTLSKWVDSMGGIVDAFERTFRNAANTAIEIFNKLIDWINDKMHFEWEAFEIAGREIVPGGSIQLFTIPHIPSFSTGGIVEDGLFMANHTELIGQFSNGKTAVANNEQIVSGISKGVKEAVAEILAPYLADIARNTRETADKDVSINIGDREIYKASLRGAKSSGRLIVT